MNNDIVEVVEEFDRVCVDCLATCLSKSREEISLALRQCQHLTATIGTCGRCHERSDAVVQATVRLRKRFETAAMWAGLAAIAGPIALPILAFGKIADHLGDGSSTSPEVFQERAERLKSAMYKHVQQLRSRIPFGQNSSVSRTTPSLPPKTSGTPKPQPIDAEWLDAKRRFIIRTLNTFDKGHDREEGFAMRIKRLRQEGRVTPDVANAIRNITALRNKAVYDEYEPVASDIQRIQTASCIVDNWASGLRVH